MTRFKPAAKDNLPEAADVDDAFYLPGSGWSMLASDVYEDGDKVVVRLEVPGMKKEQLSIEARGRKLTITGEKRFEQEQGNGRYRSFQCAYGAFQRVVPLPSDVQTDKAKATYRDGVLRVEIPKQASASPRCIEVRIP